MENAQPKVSNVRTGRSAKPDAPAVVASGKITTDQHGNQIVTDSKGRKLTLKDLNLLEEQDLLVALGPEASGNPLVLGRTLMAAKVRKIDDDFVDFPTTNRELRWMLECVGKEGLAAAMASVAAEGAGNRESEIETAKN